jgi:hypothetical protein
MSNTHDPSESDLRAVFNRCRLSGWPERFEDAMTDPLIRRYVDTLARHGPAYLRGGLNRPTPLQQTNAYLASLPTPQRRAGVDLKSRAAGERDDVE